MTSASVPETTRVGLLARIEAKPEHADDVEGLLTGALALAQEETGTTVWFALRLGPTTFGVFDAFGSDEARTAHLQGRAGRWTTSGPAASAATASGRRSRPRPPTLGPRASKPARIEPRSGSTRGLERSGRPQGRSPRSGRRPRPARGGASPSVTGRAAAGLPSPARSAGGPAPCRPWPLLGDPREGSGRRECCSRQLAWLLLRPFRGLRAWPACPQPLMVTLSMMMLWSDLLVGVTVHQFLVWLLKM